LLGEDVFLAWTRGMTTRARLLATLGNELLDYFME